MQRASAGFAVGPFGRFAYEMMRRNHGSTKEKIFETKDPVAKEFTPASGG